MGRLRVLAVLIGVLLAISIAHANVEQGILQPVELETTSEATTEELSKTLMWFDGPQTISYRTAVQICASKSAQLCTRIQVCGDNQRSPQFQQMSGDHWLPVRDHENDWIQIGTGHPICTDHFDAYGPPAWGLQDSYGAWRGRLCCTSDLQWSVVSGSMTWLQGKSMCEAQNLDLCSHAQMCAADKGTPLFTVYGGDVWAPAADVQNEWIHVGNNIRACTSHMRQYGGGPGWGYTMQNPNGNQRRLCCISKTHWDFLPLTTYYNQARDTCWSKGQQQLCSRTELCGANLRTPQYLPFWSDHWVPIRDYENDWIEIGTVHQLCDSHRELWGVPPWGADTSSRTYKGHLCCSSSMHLYDQANTMSYSDAKNLCESRGEQLCTRNQVCGADLKTLAFKAYPGDQWMPVRDRDNDWVEVAANAWPICTDHIDRFGPPTWGPGNSAVPYRGHLCCTRKLEYNNCAANPTACSIYHGPNSRCTPKLTDGTHVCDCQPGFAFQGPTCVAVPPGQPVFSLAGNAYQPSQFPITLTLSASSAAKVCYNIGVGVAAPGSCNEGKCVAADSKTPIPEKITYGQTVAAIACNAAGMKSNPVSNTYNVIAAPPGLPVFSVSGGTLPFASFPLTLTLTAPSAAKVCYTVGSDVKPPANCGDCAKWMPSDTKAPIAEKIQSGQTVAAIACNIANAASSPLSQLYVSPPGLPNLIPASAQGQIFPINLVLNAPSAQKVCYVIGGADVKPPANCAQCVKWVVAYNQAPIVDKIQSGQTVAAIACNALGVASQPVIVPYVLNKCLDTPTICGPKAKCTLTSTVTGAYRCDCNVGFTPLTSPPKPSPAGTVGCKEINDCDTPNVCGANAVCVKTGPGQHQCNCMPGYEMVNKLCTAINDCVKNPTVCGSLAKCVMTGPAQHRCDCVQGYQMSGTICKEIDDCYNNPTVCGANAKCTKTGPGTHKCDCNAGYMPNPPPTVGCKEIDPCVSSPCVPFSQCTKTGPALYRCDCIKGYSLVGKDCKEIDDCAVNPSVCGDTKTTKCVKTGPGQHRCDCLQGFTMIKNVCKDANGCDVTPPVCGDHSLCMQTAPLSHTCQCASGYSMQTVNGKQSCQEINNCLSNPCGANAICTKTGPGTHKCDCAPAKPGYRVDPKTCTPLEIDDCAEAKTPLCFANSKCLKTGPGTHKCDCFPGFKPDPSRTSCSEIDGCLAKPCVSRKNTICVKTRVAPDYFRCDCDEGYEMDKDTNQCKVIVSFNYDVHPDHTIGLSLDHVDENGVPIKPTEPPAPADASTGAAAAAPAPSPSSTSTAPAN